jgi:hypothetical protein
MSFLVMLIMGCNRPQSIVGRLDLTGSSLEFCPVLA